jgi:hypothetical protein
MCNNIGECVCGKGWRFNSVVHSAWRGAVVRAGRCCSL